MSHEIFTCELGGKTLTFETGKMAKQAGGSIVVRSGDSMVLVAATASKDPKEGIDFLPLTVDYTEKTYAAGKIPGGFFKREGRPTENAILTSRLIDRPIRPLFPEGYHFETQVIATVLSACPENNPDTLALCGASAALCISDIPFIKPIAGCRVGRVDGQLIINPSLKQVDEGDLELIVAASEDAVVMVEGGAKEVSEEDMLTAIQFAFDSLQPVIQIQKEMQSKVAKEKRVVEPVTVDAKIVSAVKAKEAAVKEALAIKVKQDRYAKLDEIKAALKEELFSEEAATAEQAMMFSNEYSALKSRLMRNDTLDSKTRIDGRAYNEIRSISCEVGLLPRAHGSALFTRGETQALVVATLGTSDDEQRIDGLLSEESKSFMLNYNFPSFSVGEVRPNRGPGRREIGHGHLAERSLKVLVPESQDFPYTIRIVSEVLESNGSSSMASVCGGSLAMMDAGVPMKAPVAGIAMGLIKEGDKVAILSDILGDEDHLGDMDFKVTGTAKGITGLQMDIKIEGVTQAIMKDALSQAREGRIHILGKMAEALSTHRTQLSANAPKIITMRINPDKIKDVIGPGGKMIKSIVEETGVKIDIEDSGEVKIFAVDQGAIDKAMQRVKDITAEAEVGQVYEGKVRRIVDFGAFVEILPKKDGLVHISQISNDHVKKVEDVLKEGDTVKVKVIKIDNTGRVSLTMKDVDAVQEASA